MSDPSRMVCVPSLDDPGSAPPGHTTLYVLEPVPNLAAGNIDWVAERPRMRERLLNFLDARGYPTDIVTEATLSFLGVGLKSPVVSWGIMINEAQSYLRVSPFLLFFLVGETVLVRTEE